MTNLVAGLFFLIIGVMLAVFILPDIKKKRKLEKKLWEIHRERNDRLARRANKMAKRLEEE